MPKSSPCARTDGVTLALAGDVMLGRLVNDIILACGVAYCRAEPSAVETLRLAGVDFASLANNHSGDFGPEGLLETIAVLDPSSASSPIA